MVACITGFGIVDALGYSPNECLANYMTDRIFTQEIETRTKINTCYRLVDVDRLTLPPGLTINKMSKITAMMFDTVDQAVKMAGISFGDTCGSFITTGLPVDLLKTQYSWYFDKSKRRLGPRQLLDVFSGSSSSTISQYYKFDGYRATAPAACASGLASIEYALKYINDYDYLLVGTSEMLDDLSFIMFDTLGALSNVSMPFDKKRTGFVMGEGSGCLVIESEEKARARGAVVYGKIYPPGFATDQGSATAPDPEGRGALLSMQKAMQNANKTSIDVVNAHATSTPLGDEIEYQAIRRITDAPIFSCKSKIGHLTTSSNINELIYSILLSRKGCIGYNANLTEPLEGSYNLPSSIMRTDKEVITTMKNSFGFGGRCMSVVVDVAQEKQ